MALSSDITNRIHRYIEDKGRGSKSAAASGFSTEEEENERYQLSSSIIDTIRRNISTKRLGREDPGVDDSYIDLFFNDSQSFITNSQNEWSSLDYNSGRDQNLYSQRETNAQDLRDRALSIRTYLDINKDSINPEYYQAMTDYLDQFDISVSGIMHNFSAAQSFYNSFANEDDYLKWDAYQTPEGRQQRYADNQERLEELDELINAEGGDTGFLNWIGQIMGNAAAGRHELVPYKESEYQKEYDAIQAEMRMYELGNTDQSGFYYGYKAADDYAKYREDPNFEALSANRNFMNPSREDLDIIDITTDSSTWYFDADNNLRDAYGTLIDPSNTDKDGSIVHPSISNSADAISDPLGMYLNTPDNIKIDAVNMGNTMQGTFNSIIRDGFFGNWELLKEDEVDMYYYLLNSKGREAAVQYLTDMTVELNRRDMEADTARYKESFEEANALEKLALSIATIPPQLLGSATAFIDDASAVIRGDQVNPYSQAHEYLNFSSTIRGEQAAELDEITNGAAIPFIDFTLGDAYQAAMSFADMFVGGKLGRGYEVLMGMGSASSEARRLYEQGATQEQMMFGALLAGGAEIIAEHASIDSLINMKDATTVGQIVKNALIQGGVEASEEGLTELANTLTNALVMGNESDWAKLLEENNGDYLAAFTAKLGDIGSAAMGGFLSGAMGGGVESAGSALETRSQDKAYGRYITGTNSTDALLALAQEMAGSTSGSAQKRMNAQIESVSNGKFRSDNKKNRAVGKLYSTVLSQANEQNISEISEALQEQGISKKTATEIAGAIVVQASGFQLTNDQQKLLDEYGSKPAVKSVVEDILGNAESGINQRAKSIASFEFKAMRNQKASRMEQAAPQQKNAPAQDAVVSTQESGAEVHYEVSEGGQTVLKSSGEAVNIAEIAANKDGQMTLKLGNGSTVAAEDVVFSSESEALIYETVATMGVNAKAANILVNGYKAAQGKGLAADVYAHGISEAYRYGKLGIPASQLEKSDFASKLTPAQQDYAYRQGRKAAGKQVAKQQAAVNKSYKEAIAASKGTAESKNSVVYHAILEKGISAMELNATQKASYQLADNIAQAASVNIIVYAGITGEHGYYDYQTDTIHLNLNAVNMNRQSMMAFTLGHELVHRAKAGSPAKYQVFANFLMEQYGKQNSNVEEMIAQESEAANRFGIKMSREEAFEEVVCDACERMLLDTDAGQKLAEFGSQSAANKSFLEDLKRWIKEFMDKLRSIFQDVEPGSMAAKEFAKFDANVKQILSDMYVDMTIDAGVHLSTIQNAFGKGTVVKTNEQGQFTMAQSADGSKVAFNLVTWKNGGRATLEAALLREGYTEEEVSAALTIMDAKQELVEKIANEVDENGRMAFPEQGRINEATLTTDLKDGHSVLSALVSNGDYPVNIDLLMVCKKRKAYQRVINRLCETGMIQQATVDALAIAEINKILGKYGFETACLGCFVESRRLRIQEWAQTIVKEWNAEVKKRNPNAKPFGFGKGEAKLTPDEVMQLIGELESGGEKNDKGNLNLGQGSAVKRMGVLLDKVPTLRRTLSVEDLITPDGLTALRQFDSNLFSMVKSRYGSNSPKFVQEFNPYNHELAVYGKVPTQYNSLREYLYAIGGARMQSFSDFIVENWFDYCQIVADLAARKLPMHTYTKEIALARLFGMTGIKINMSLIPDVDRSLGKEYAGLTMNKEGELELIWADKDRFKATGGTSYMQSINFADAVALQNDPRYSANVGTIAVGISDMHIRMMLNDSRIRMVIPYHSSGMNPIFADLMGTSYYKDYTLYQNTTIKQLYNSEGKPVFLKLEKAQEGKLTSGFLFNEALQELGDARAAAEAYKDWCADTSKHTITIKGETYTAELTPKFDDFKDEANYYKLLEDFNPYDCITEQAAPQGDVQQTYPEGFEDILRAELSGQERYRQKQEKNQAFDKAMEEIESYLKNHTKADTVHYANQHGIKLGAKDKKLNATDKAKLKQLQKEGVSFSLPKAIEKPTDNKYSSENRKADTQAKVTARYRRTVDQVLAGTYNSKDNILMGYTPEIFTKLGMPSLPFVIGPGHVYTATVTETEAKADPLNRYKKGGHYHGLGVNTVKNLYSAIQDPIMIIAAKDIVGQKRAPRSLHSVVAIVDVGDATKQLLLPVELTATRIVGGNRMDVNVLSSSYKRSVENLVEEAIAQMYAGDIGVYYAKKEATALLSGRVSFPKQLTEAIASNGIVHRFPEKVNMAISDVTQSLQFTNWFGDWQNDPQHSSKVVNDDGTPMIVYHGTKSGNIKTFRTVNKNGTGGLFLSTNRSVAKGFAGANGEVYETYVNLRNPFIVDADVSFYDSIAIPDEMKGTRYAFGNTVDTNAIAAYARAAGYDGVIIRNVREPSGFGDDIIAFESTQVKSVDNIGTFDKTKDNSMYKLPVGEDTSPRALLTNAFESIITNPIEKSKLEEYKGKVEMLNAEEQKLRELKAEIKELSFANGKRDTKRIKELQFDAIQTANRIATLDKTLLRFEASAPLQSILQREKEMVRKRERQRADEALEAYRRDERARNAAWRDEVKQKYKDSKKQVIETREKREAREKLQKLVLDTVKWITYPTKTDVKCPDMLKQPYADFLNGIDMSSRRLAKGGDPTKNDLRLANAMSSLATALDRIMVSQDPNSETTAVLDTGYLDLPPNFVQKLREMTESINAMMVDGEYVINNMSAAEVRQLAQMIRTLNHAIKEMSTLYANLRFANIEALGDDSMGFMDDLGEIDKTSGIADFVEWDNALPYYAFRRFGSGGESIFEGLMDAQDKLAFLAQQIFNFQEKTWTGAEAKKWSEDTHTIDLPNGGKLTLTTADAMSIYCLSRRKQGLQHLLGGGTRVMGIQEGSRKAKDSRSLLTIQDIDAIISSLSDRQRKVAEAIQEFMSTVCSDWGNEISMKRFLTREFTEKFYFPIESNDENLATKDPSAQQSDLFRLLNISATKPIDPRANNEVIIRNIFDVFTGHASDMARLNAFGMPLLDYMKWLNYREKTVNEDGQIQVRGVRKSMEKAFGNAAKSYVLNLVKDVNGRASDGGDPSILMKWMRTAKTASVGSSIRVATLQITSYPRAALILSPRSLALGLSKMPKIEMAKKYCGIALWKSFGFYDTNISRSIEDQMKGVKDVRQKLIELSLKGAELGDAITWGAMWNACEYEVAATKKYTVGTEEFYQAVGKKLREVVYSTQVVDSTLTRSQIMRSKRGTAQEAAAFMSEPTLSANILMDAGFKFGMEKRRSGSAKAAWDKTGKYVAKAVAVYSIGQLAAALLEGLWDAWRDDEDEAFGEKYIDAFIENLVLDLLPFNKIPILSDVFEAVLAMFDIGFYSSDKMSTTWLTQAVSAVDAWKSVFGGKSSTTAYNALYKTVRALSSFYGVSFSGVMREAVALWNNTAGAYDSTLKIRSYEVSKSDMANQFMDAVIDGNQRQADSLREQFEDEEAFANTMRSIIKERYLSGEIDTSAALKYLFLYGGMDAEKAWWKVDEWDYEKASGDGDGYSKYNDFFTAVETGKNLKAIINEYTANGVELKTLSSQISEHFKPIYTGMSASERAALKGYLLNAYELCGVDREDATKKLQYWDFLADYPDTDLTQYQIADYYEFAKPAGISVDMYADYCEMVKDINGEGKKERRMAVIDSLPITSAQKDALYYAEGWAESKIDEAPWH